MIVSALYADETAPVDALALDRDGFVGRRRTRSPLRHLLLLPTRTLVDLDIARGALRENVLLDDADDALHALPSGTELAIGTARLRLTVHCEPCAKTRPYARADRLAHRRGYLAQVVEPGVLRVGDAAAPTGRVHPSIPYAVAERIAEFLATQGAPVGASALLHAVGVHRSYARALPKLLAKLSPELAARVVFAKGGATRR